MPLGRSATGSPRNVNMYILYVVYVYRRVHIGVFGEQDITHMHKFDPEPTLMFRLSIRLGVGS